MRIQNLLPIRCECSKYIALSGSPNLYSNETRSNPWHSLNFITAHDGFTLRDVFSYNHKHNYSNGENNRDGSDNNYSYNFGMEGYGGADYQSMSPYSHISLIRRRCIKNALLMLCVSRGIPMIQAGDEYGRSTNGNNNM